MVLLLRTIAEIRSHLKIYRQTKQGTIGLVPTMGALHAGHLSLMDRAIAENDFVVVSIFVNPLQFAPTEDLSSYPRQLERDLELCESRGVDLVFAPTPEQMNSEGDTDALDRTTKVIPPPAKTDILCGKYRPGHFIGVATIVTKLFNIIQPDRAYFGQKDAQQLAIIYSLCRDLNISIQIVPCPIVREESGLALSSRNQYLTELQKEQAANIYRSLRSAQQAFEQGENRIAALIDLVKQKLKSTPEVKIQYVELVEPISLDSLECVRHQGLLAIAAYVGSTRLIDNIVLQKRLPIIAIDGPAGAGKSTVTRSLAYQLGLTYLDTGAMYRAVTWLIMQLGVAIDDEQAIANSIQDLNLVLKTRRQDTDIVTEVYVNDEEVTTAIRTPEVTANVSTIAAQAAVREKLVQMQQQWGESGGLIAEGRDIGTNVFPNAELKIFLTATPAERARRRSKDLEAQGRDVDLKQLEADIRKRDEQDSNRAIAPLKKADDAIELVTDNLTIEEVIAKIVDLYRQI